jgi:lipopolysaccharide biosynthesis regulator YciM
MTQIDYNKKQYRQVIEQGKALLAEQQNDYFDAELNRLVGESYFHLGNDNEARTYLRRYLDNPEGEPYRTAAYTMGVLDYRNGNYEAVVNDMQHVTDGSDALSQSAYEKLMRYERYGMIALLALVWSGVLGSPLSSAVTWLFDKLFAVAEFGFHLVGGSH